MSLRSGLRCAGLATFIILAFTGTGRAACIPTDSPQTRNHDVVTRVLELQAACPADALEFRKLLESAGARLEPTMVNFVGFHNPDPGAFFIFEIASGAVRAAAAGGAQPATMSVERGDLLFGHFLNASNNKLVVNREDSSSS